MEKLSNASQTETGLVRQNNQDCFLADEKLGLWLVADGMGGHQSGEIASQLASDIIQSEVDAGATIERAILTAHAGIMNASSSGGKSEDCMGTTVVALHTNAKDYTIGWVGDSRAYLWDRKQKTLKQITKDHSYVQSLYDQGIITQQQMREHLHKNIITQSLGINTPEAFAVDTLKKRWKPEQTILLCSDGLTDSVSDADMNNLLTANHEKSLSELAELLCHAANQSGGKDNITVQLVDTPVKNNKITRTLLAAGTLATALAALALSLLINTHN
ncbi:Protein phosphatase PrpC [BD1-7 clade bacterium]|uniref:Protein phosphatase PrpC n=1 Tax=BD1-7 clade bacterium TaxID=2029982 RepID=A0A5S9QNF9_9GAMM|nr:Protein phosphatase PrpC [BD1-7 clade bacterium]CAA0120651.1 Protein phosphatase PrpC [BD1-7 clade bacterium]